VVTPLNNPAWLWILYLFSLLIVQTNYRKELVCDFISRFQIIQWSRVWIHILEVTCFRLFFYVTLLNQQLLACFEIL
jgi:hypothetical protein